MYPGVHAATTPDKPAVIVPGRDQVLTYAQLEERSTRLADALRTAGLHRGDVVALVSPNDARFFEVYWACLRSGLYLTPVNVHLSAEELAYVVRDCDARALIVSAELGQLVQDAAQLVDVHGIRLAYGGQVPGFDDYEEAVASASPRAPTDQPRGADMLYSSGTAGQPKGVKPPLPDRQVGDPGDAYVDVFGTAYGFGSDSVYFSPSPLYHAAPLRLGMVTQSLGGTVVVLPRFDARACLEAIEAYGVTHSQWVPTHFVRILRLPHDVLAAYDTSSQRCVIHAAAPCPIEVKRGMFALWGPILYEYYASTEANGVTMIGPQEWLERPGSVGRPVLGKIHVCDDDDVPLPPREIGLVWFERERMPFVYHRDPVKTLAAQHPRHPAWSTSGDVGWLDEDGYLYLTDRKAFTIISGGVTIYPQEIEDLLALHPDVFDVAVVGVPDEEFGESVLAVVHLADGTAADDATRQRLTSHLRARIAGYKVPKRFEFVDSLPRTPTGKLLKRQVRDHWAQLAAPRV